MLRNRKEQSERKLTGVNRVADPSKLKLGTFQALQNWIPAKRYKIKKKRGPQPLLDTAEVLTPTLCSALCNDTTLRGQQSLTQVVAFDQANSTTSPGLNARSSWGYISPDGEVTTLYGDATCDSGNMDYGSLATPPAPPICVQLNHYIDGVSTVHDYPTIIDSTFGNPAINTRCGTSDEPCYNFNF